MVTVYDEVTGERLLAEDLFGYGSRAGFAKTEETGLRRTEQPCVPVVTIRAPGSFIGVFDGGLPVFLDQFVNHRFQQMGHAVQRSDQAAGANAQLSLQTTQGHTVDVMLHHDMGEQLIPIKALGQNSGRSGLEAFPTAGTPPSLKTIDHSLLLEGLTIHHRPPTDPFVLQRPPAAGTRLVNLHDLHPVCLLGIHSLTPMTYMSPLGPSTLRLPLLQRIRLDRHLGRGG
jgi:hypothetical protein